MAPIIEPPKPEPKDEDERSSGFSKIYKFTKDLIIILETTKRLEALVKNLADKNENAAQIISEHAGLLINLQSVIDQQARVIEQQDRVIEQLGKRIDDFDRRIDEAVELRLLRTQIQHTER
jgi:hypothetical protein